MCQFSFSTGTALMLFFKLIFTIKSSHSVRFNLKQGILDTTYTTTINFNSQHIYEFLIPKETLENYSKNNLLVETYVANNASRSCPLLFTVKQSTSSVFWNLPQFVGSERYPHKYVYKANRTMCLEPYREDSTRTVIVEISTCSRKVVSYTIFVTFMQNTILKLDTEYIVQTSVSSPTFYKYYFKRTSPKIVFIHVLSNSPDCMLVAVQSPKCPVINKETNIRFDGFWQTVTFQTGITIQRHEFPNGFFLSFAVLPDDSHCSQDFGVIRPHSRNVSRKFEKTLRVIARAGLNGSDYVWPIMVPLFFFGGLVATVFFIFAIFHRLRCRIDDEHRKKCKEDPEEFRLSSASYEDFSSHFPIQNSVFICHIRKMGDADLLRKSKRYYFSMITIVIFYLVPVFQLIIHYMEVMKSTGEQDLCFYNYLCSHPLDKFKDFNHSFSNVGYVILGLYFLLLVCIREKCCVSEEKELEPLDTQSENTRWKKWWPIFPKTLKRNDHGTIQPIGNYVAMALGHTLEGLMSATYHICPNQSNFQFDMAFMYVIAVLNITNVYTYRHPVYISATLMFACLGMVACSAVFGLMFQSYTFLLCFSIFYGIFVFFILFYLYHVGNVLINGELQTTFFGVYKALCLFSCRWLSKRLNKVVRITDSKESKICFLSGRLKFILPLGGGVFNGILILGVWTVLHKHNFAIQVLTIFVVNSTGYSAYYSIMKLIHKECKSVLSIQPLIYAIMSITFWLIGLYYFTIVLTSWETSAAESRVKNSPCIAMGFYDFHDIWHFYSAAAMFCSFMTLLTLDDDLLNVPQYKIPVF